MPPRTSLLLDLLEEAIPCGTPLGGIFDLTPVGRALGDEGRCRAALVHRVVTGLRVVRLIPRHLPNRIRNLPEERRYPLAIMNATLGKVHRDDFFCRLINPQVQLAHFLRGLSSPTAVVILTAHGSIVLFR